MDIDTPADSPSVAPESTPNAPRSAWKTFAPLLIVLVLALATAGAYFNTKNSPLVFDDLHLIQFNPIITDGSFKDVVTTEYWAGYQRGLIQSQRLYRPLTMWTYQLNWNMSDPRSEGSRGSVPTTWFHFTNALLHFLTVLLVYAVGWHVFNKNRWIAAAGALLFALHPIHTEAVTRITGRADVLAGLFVFLTWWLYIKATETRADRPMWATVTLWSLTFVSFFLGLVSKEITVVVVPIVIFYDLVVRHMSQEGLSFGRAFGALFSKRLLGYSGIAATLVIVVGIRTAVFMQDISVGNDLSTGERLGVVMDNVLPETDDIAPLDNALIGMSFSERVDDVLHLIGYQIGLLLAPITLSADYSYHQIPISKDLISAEAAPWALATLAIFIAGLVFLFSKRPKIGFLILFFFIAIIPVCNFFVLIGTNLGERNLYIASASICWGLAWAAFALWKRQGALKIVAAVALLGIVGFYGWRTIDRNEDYSSERRLWIATVEDAPNSPRAHLNLADVYFQEGAFEEARKHAARANELMPEFVRSDLRLGDIAAALGQLDEAIEHYRAVIDKLGDRLIFPDGPDAMHRLAQSYVQLGEFEKGAEVLLQYAEHEMWRLFAEMEAATVLSEQATQTGQLDILPRVRELLENAARIEIVNGGENAKIVKADVYRMLGFTYHQLEQNDLAIKAYRQSLRLDPEQALPSMDLARLLIEKKDYTRALERIDKAIQLRPNFAMAYLVKAEVYEGFGDFETALSQGYQEALKQSQNERNPQIFMQLGRAFLRWADRFQGSDDPLKRSRAKEMFDKAKEILRQGSDLDPDNVKPKLLIAEAFYQLGQLDEAIDTYRSLLGRATPIAHRCHRRIADFLAELGETQKAEEHYLQAIDLNPQGPNTHLAYLMFLHQQGRDDEAQEIIDFLIANNRPSEPETVVTWIHENIFESHEFAQFFSEFYEDRGEHAKADAWGRKVIEIAQRLTQDPDTRELGIEVGCNGLGTQAKWFIDAPEGSERHQPRRALSMAYDALQKSAGKDIANRAEYRVTFARAAQEVDDLSAVRTAVRLAKEARQLLPEDERIPEIQEKLKEKLKALATAKQNEAATDDGDATNGDEDR
ncbi:MAG: tetratricopeptide repeat protein [Planctomycetota bacterium]